MPGRRRSIRESGGPLPQTSPVDNIRESLRIDLFAGAGSLVLSELVGMWAMSKVDWPHMVEVFTAIFIATLISYLVSRLVTHAQLRRRPTYASDVYGGQQQPPRRRQRPTPLDARGDYRYDDEDDLYDDRHWEYE